MVRGASPHFVAFSCKLHAACSEEETPLLLICIHNFDVRECFNANGAVLLLVGFEANVEAGVKADAQDEVGGTVQARRGHWD